MGFHIVDDGDFGENGELPKVKRVFRWEAFDFVMLGGIVLSVAVAMDGYFGLSH